MKKKPLVPASIEAEQIKKLRQITRKQIPLSNDVFMIFAMNKKFCQEFLRVILQDKKLVVIKNNIQKHLPNVFSKSVIIDMLCILGNGSIVNVEIQLTKEKWHAKRIMQYASKIKTYTTKKGTKYKDIKELIIIYLTAKDIFKKGSTVYEVEMNVVSDLGKIVEPWDAGLKVYYVNTVGLTNKTINQYLKLLTDKTTISQKYKTTSEIKDLIYGEGETKMSSEMKKWINDIRKDARQEGKAAGIVEGMEKGKIEGKIELVLNMFKKKLIELKDAAKLLGMSEENFSKLANV